MVDSEHGRILSDRIENGGPNRNKQLDEELGLNSRKAGNFTLFELIQVLKKHFKTHKDIVEIKINNCLWNNTPYEIFIRPTVFHNQQCFVVGIIDATVRNLNVFLKGSNLQKTMILGYISHNIQTPLSRIKMYLDTFKWTYNKEKEFKQQMGKNDLTSPTKTGKKRRKNSKKADEISGLEMAICGMEELFELNNDIKVFHDITNNTLDR